MLNPDLHSFFLSILTECHNNSRQEITNRNAIIAFYTTFLSFYIGFSLPDNSFLTNQESYMVVVITICLCLIGFVCSYSVINCRAWITQYANCIIAVNNIFATEEDIAGFDSMNSFLKKYARQEKDRLPQLVKRPGNLIVISFILFSSVPLILQALIYHKLMLIIWAVYIAGLLTLHVNRQNDAMEQKNGLTYIINFYQK